MAKISKMKVIFTAVIVLVVAISGIVAVFYPQMGEFFTGQLTRLDVEREPSIVVEEEPESETGEETGTDETDIQFHRASTEEEEVTMTTDTTTVSSEDEIKAERTEDQLAEGEQTSELTYSTLDSSETQEMRFEEDAVVAESDTTRAQQDQETETDIGSETETEEQVYRSTAKEEDAKVSDTDDTRTAQESTEETDPKTTATDDSAPEPLVTCEGLENALSQAFYSKNWTKYEAVMADIDEYDCYTYCMNNFYHTVMYISLSDLMNARSYYQDDQCTDCEMVSDLNAYAAEEYSRTGGTIDQTEHDILYDLTINTLNYCAPPHPESFNAFINSLVFDAAKYFGQRREAALNKSNDKENLKKGLSQIFPTAYAQSDSYTVDVEDTIREAYYDMYGTEEVSECRSLEIIRPEDAVGDTPVVVVPQTGFQNTEIAIQVDADSEAVSLYRYKSLEATITFDDEGTIYDTEAKSALMNHRDTSKGDIVTVWALDNDMQGIQECHDSFYVEFEEDMEPPPMAPPPIDETYAMEEESTQMEEPPPMAPPSEPEDPEPEAIAMAPPPPPTAPAPTEPPPTEPVFTPVMESTDMAPPPAPAPAYALHAAAPDGYVAFHASPGQTSETGPAFFYLIGAGLAGAYVKKRVKKIRSVKK